MRPNAFLLDDRPSHLRADGQTIALHSDPPQQAASWKRTLVTAAIFICAVLVYIVGVETESGLIILIGLVLEGWCLVRAGRH